MKERKRVREAEVDAAFVLDQMRGFCGISSKDLGDEMNLAEDATFREKIGASVPVIHAMWHLMQPMRKLAPNSGGPSLAEVPV